jgi:hypothetical protein
MTNAKASCKFVQLINKKIGGYSNSSSGMSNEFLRTIEHVYAENAGQATG